MTKAPDAREILLPVLDHLLLTHPLPWRMEQDWTLEVVASDRAIIAKCRSSEEAQAIIEHAEKRQEELDRKQEEIRPILEEIERG